MNEKGFATIFGLCLILVIALIVKGIQESEMNHAYETTDYQAEFDLQNAAESGIYKAVAIVLANPDTLIFNKEYPSVGNVRKKAQHPFTPITINSSSGSINVRVWGERIVIKPYEVNYERMTSNKYNTYPFIVEDKQYICQKACVFFSVAELTDSRTGEKSYRRAYAYFIESNLREKGGSIKEEVLVAEEEKNIIHFMETTQNNLSYKTVNNPDRH
ncbi:MAG: hypothetical protein IKT98_00960 [Selenomonadaceae bacterium]|nr:hypothetical protein [Selenomonadaceae bacterium]